uniref:microtubule-associated protein futsch-like n=1 Tax=Semicossyphus pulcher TaxID=241346 RepID=UPI0037E7657C
MDDIEKASNRGSMCPTIMLTGLPEGNYKQEEVAKLVWPYFPKKNLHSLYYNVTVLPLQRRAFVFFADWITCCNFVKDHIKKRVSLRGDMISVHFVLQHMYPESTEEMMYKSLMKWSNAGVPDPNSLEERLLIVEISEASVDVIAFVIEVVTSITMFVSVLPLANRICIEMTDSNSVMQVVEKCNDLSSNSFTEDPAWRKVQKVEPLKSLKQRLQDSAEVTINLDLDTSSVENESPEIDKNVLKAIKVTVGQQRLVQESRAQSEEKEGQDNFTDDNVTSEAYLFDDQNFNEDCFITVDEVGDDVEVTSPDYYRSSSSKHSSRERRERQSSHVFSARNRTSTRSSKDYKSSASSSRSTKDSRSSYSSSELKKSSKHTNSPPKPSSSSCAGKASSSPPVSTDSPSSLGHKRQQSRTKSPAKSLDASAGRNRSSSPVHEREKNTAETVAASVKTCPEQLGDEARDTNSAVAKSDHDVSAEGPAAKSDESETKIETEKMHPPQQGCGSESSQAQSLDSDSNVKTLKDREKSTEEGKEDDKHVEVEIDCGSCLNSSNDQTDEQMENGGQKGSCETQITGPVGGQVLDSVEEEDKACHEEPSDMFMEDSLQVLDSVTKDQAATGPESSCVVQVDSSPGKQRSEEDALPIFKQSEDTPLIKDGVGNEQQTNNEDNSEVDTSSKQAPRSKGDEKKTKQNRKVVKDKMLSAESCEASKDAENLKSQDVNEEGDIKNHDSDGTEQEAFEILDSIDDQTETEDVSQKPETSSAQISKEDNRPIEEEEDAYQVIDSLEDQPTTTETESETDKGRIRTKKGEATASKCDRPSRRSGPKSKVSVSEEKEKSPKKQDRTVKKYETRTKVDIIADKEVTEEIMFEIVDSVGEEPVEDAATREWSGRRRSTRGKKEDRVNINLTEASEKPEEVTFKIIDSVENETANDEPTVTRRSTRGRRGNTMKDALSEKTVKEDTPTRRRQTPARESQSREKTPKKEEKAPPKESTPTRKSANAVEVSEEDATYEILDSVEDEVVEDVPPATTGKRKRGRPKKHVKTTIKGSTTSKRVDKDGSEKVADEEETTYQIVDSVEDDKVDDQPPSDEAGGSRAENISESIDKPQKRTSLAGTTKKEEEEEEEPLFHIIDSLEDDPVQEEQTATDKSNRKIKEKRKTKDESPWKEIEKGDKQKCGTTVSEAFEKLVEEGLHQKVDDDEEVNDPPSIIEGCSTGEKERTPPTDIVKEETSPIISTSDTVILERENKQKSPEKKHGASTLVNLDEVSDEEEDYPDDTADKEELRKRQSAAKEKQFANKRETRRTREREERERRSRTSSSRGEGDGGGTRRGKKRVREDEKVELVTLDTVGADEAERQQWEEEVTEGEVQELVTLDEFVEEEPDGKAEQSKLETPPLSQEDESVDDLNQESLVTLDEVGYDDEDKPDTGQAKKTLRSGKRKHDDDTEASMNFVILDEVKDEETREASKPRTRGRPRKKVRQTPVRKSTRGKNVSSQEEKEKESTVEVPPTPREASLLDKSQSKPEIPEIAEVEAASPVDIDAALAGQEQQPENKTGRSRADIKVVSKRRKESVGPEAKRSRSQSPSVPADVKLPASQPDNSLNFMVPGFFCSLCSIFNPDETARELHCSSQKHINNLQKHYQKLQQKSSSSTQS